MTQRVDFKIIFSIKKKKKKKYKYTQKCYFLKNTYISRSTYTYKLYQC